MLIQLEQSQLELRALLSGIAELEQSIDIPALSGEVSLLEEQSNRQDFWSDPTSAQSLLKKLNGRKSVLDRFNNLKSEAEDLDDLIELAILDESDSSIADEIISTLDTLKRDYEQQRIDLLLSGEYDGSNALLSIHPGAGGTEAQDWAQMLYRMYIRYAERKNFKVKVLDYLDGDEAGLKSATLLIEGPNAYGYLKSETGVHRLVRISPFDSSGRRHTSFTSVEVIPEFNEEIEIDINEADLRIDTHRSSGAGGQHVNKTDSAVRITHLPTGIVVACQNERSQMQNRETAMKMLKSKLLEIKEREQLEKIDDIKGVKLNIEWGSQIRSYVFMPYTLVKDNRTDYETGNIVAVMDGDLDGFINAYLNKNIK